MYPLKISNNDFLIKIQLLNTNEIIGYILLYLFIIVILFFFLLIYCV